MWGGGSVSGVGKWLRGGTPVSPSPVGESEDIVRMSVTGRSYTQDLFKVQCVIIQAILSRKSMEKFTVTDEKIFYVYKAFDHEK